MSGPPVLLAGVSVIISSRNRPDLLYQTVRSILDADELPAELVIIDQSDRPHDALEALQPPVGCEIRYRWAPSIGVSKGRNSGIATASHDLLAFTDDDVRVTTSWLGTLVRALIEQGPAAIVTGRVLSDGAGASHFAGALRVSDVPMTYSGKVDQDVLASGNMAAPRHAIVSVGGFDERLGPGASFPAAEDGDLGFRILEAGYTIVYVPEAVLYHRSWRPIGDYFGLRWAYGRGKGAYYAKHLRLRVMVGQVPKRLSRAARSVWRQPRRGIGELVFITGMLQGFSEWLLTQRSER